MKKIFIIVVLFTLFSVNTRTVLGHVLTTDGSIGAVLHVSPDDDPVAGETTNFFFEFKDKDNKFDPVYCDCKVSIKEGDSEIYSGKLFSNSSNPSLENASFSFVFPHKNVFKIVVAGRPVNGGEFQEFNLSYDVRVARGIDNVVDKPNNSTWLGTHVWHIAIGALLTGLTFVLILKAIKKK